MTEDSRTLGGRRIPITKTSMFSGKAHVAWLPVTVAQMERYNTGRENIAAVFPDIPPEWREFIKTGVTPAEWKKEFGRVRSADYDGPEPEPPIYIEEIKPRRPSRGI